MIGRYISFKMSPVTKHKKLSSQEEVFNGFYWKKSAVDLANALNVSLFDIFPPELWDNRRSKYEIEVDSSDLLEYTDLKILSENTPESAMIKKENSDGLLNVLSTLTPREKSIIEKRFGLNGNEAETLEIIGEYFGISKARAQQIEAKALHKLRHPSIAKEIIKYTR